MKPTVVDIVQFGSRCDSAVGASPLVNESTVQKGPYRSGALGFGVFYVEVDGKGWEVACSYEAVEHLEEWRERKRECSGE